MKPPKPEAHTSTPSVVTGTVKSLPWFSFTAARAPSEAEAKRRTDKAFGVKKVEDLTQEALLRFGKGDF